MKKLLIGISVMFLFILLGTGDPIGTWTLLKKNDGTALAGDSVAPAETIKTWVYSLPEGMSGYASLAVGLDSVRDSIICTWELAESWDNGVTWEFVTTLGTMTGAKADFDTVLEVNFYPAPDNQIWGINGGTGTDTFSIDYLKLYNHPR